jgi:hypothetical protein
MLLGQHLLQIAVVIGPDRIAGIRDKGRLLLQFAHNLDFRGCVKTIARAPSWVGQGKPVGGLSIAFQ